MRSYVGILAVLVMLVAFASSEGLAKSKSVAKKPRPQVQMAAMGFKPPQMKAAGQQCHSAFLTCLDSCKGGTSSGCQMECETDCSICALEETNELDSKLCER